MDYESDYTCGNRWILRDLIHKLFVFTFLATFLILSHVFKFQSYAAPVTLKEIDVPVDGNVYSGNLSDVIADLKSSEPLSRYLWYPLVGQLNSLVYTMEHQSDSLPDFPYVTVFSSATGDSVTSGNLTLRESYLRIYISEAPLLLSVKDSGKNKVLFGSFEKGGLLYTTLDPAKLTSDTPVFKIDVQASYPPNGYSDILLSTQFENGNVYDYADILYANYDIPVFRSEYGGSVVEKGLRQNYEKYSDKYNGSAGNSDYVYESGIPAPQNLKLDFLKTNVGIFGFSRRTDLQLSWSNALVDAYSVQISADITMEYTPGEGTQSHGKKRFTHKLVGFSQSDSGGPDAGYPASTGKYTISEDELVALAKKQLHVDYAIVERVYVNSFRVQFYKIDSGVVNVGPVGVISLSYSALGKYQGSTSTVEYPIDSSDIGEGGLMPDDSGKWSGDGSGSEYDEDGNYTGSSEGSSGGSSGGSGSVSWSDALKNLLNGLVNIPTIIASMFESLTNMMAGIGQLPAFVSQVVSWLPSELISLIGLGIVIVIVLRIFGR